MKHKFYIRTRTWIWTTFDRFDCIAWQWRSHGMGILANLCTIFNHEYNYSCKEFSDDCFVVHINHSWYLDRNRFSIHLVEKTPLCKCKTIVQTQFIRIRLMFYYIFESESEAV